jgi:1-deoxy-D-xylulose-5-phosphate synthase
MHIDIHSIEKPEHLKNLSISDLEQISSQIRSIIIRNVSKNGGHLAPSLGVVELTVVLHHLYACPTDKIVWDVGHQAYAHKILTGRCHRMNTLRQYMGLCGFPKISESPYDAFSVGHSSTSISASLGMALARDYQNEKYEVVAVIGDGALTGGLSFEGLNNAGASNTNITIIINDNQMSISPNVGAISKYLTRLGKKLPLGNNGQVRQEPEGFYQALGFKYFGPVDGHSIPSLIDTLTLAKSYQGPKIIHVLTRKGKGYRYAEENPTKFHGTPPFDTRTGEVKSKGKIPSYTKVFGDFLTELAKQDERIVAITAGMTTGTGLAGFAETFPHRFFDVGIAEGHAVTFAAGLATQGLRPVVAIYSSFLQRAFDQLIHDVALENLPVIFCIDRAGIVGDDGPTHHGVFDNAFLRSIPNLTIMAPKDENELRAMIYSATLYSGGPVAIRYPRGQAMGVSPNPRLCKIAVGAVEPLLSGSEIAILGLGPIVYEGLAAAERLAEEGVNISVYNARFLKPIKASEIEKLCSTYKCILTLEEGTIKGGLGNEMGQHIADKGYQNIELIQCGLWDQFIEQGERAFLLRKYGLHRDAICQRIARSRTFTSHAIRQGVFSSVLKQQVAQASVK